MVAIMISVMDFTRESTQGWGTEWANLSSSPLSTGTMAPNTPRAFPEQTEDLSHAQFSGRCEKVTWVLCATSAIVLP